MNNKRAAFVIVFFFVFAIIAILLQRVEISKPASLLSRIELKEISFQGYTNNKLTYTISAKSARSNNNTDYSHLTDVVCSFAKRELTIKATQSTLGLYSIFLNKGVNATLGKTILLTTTALNYNIKSGKVIMRAKTKITINNMLTLEIKSGEYVVSTNLFVINNLSIKDNGFFAHSKHGVYDVFAKELTLTKNIKATFKEDSNPVKISAEKLVYSIETGNFNLGKDIKVTIKGKSAFSQKGFYNKKTNALTLLENAYILEETGRLNAGKIKINTSTSEMEAFDNVEAVIEVRN